MCGRVPSCSCWTSSGGPVSSLEYRPIISALRDSYGVILSTTGMRFVPRGTDGASIGFALLLGHVDVIRLDHFRGFAAAWHVPAGANTAQSGEWVPGPGATLFQTIRQELGHLPFIAEDLGIITADVASLRDQFQIPGTRVLQFAFDGHPDNPYLPHNFVSNTVAYTGTHDNPPTREWYEQLPDSQKQTLWGYLNRRLVNSAEAAPALIELAWSSVAALTVAPLQDVFDLGTGARMNVPGRANGNWRWRFTDKMVSTTAFEWLRELTERSKRCATRAQSLAATIGGRRHFFASERLNLRPRS